MNDRQNELMRKKQLLAQIRAGKKAADEAPPPPAAQAPERDVSIDLDGLLSSLPPSTAAPPVPEAVPESSAPAPCPQSASPSEPAPRPQIAQVENSVQTKEIISYTRETQTDFTSSDSEDWTDSDFEAPAPVPQKDCYTRETQTDFTSSDSEESTDSDFEAIVEEPVKEGHNKLALEQELFDKKWTSGRMVMDICNAPSRPEWIAVSYAAVPFTKRTEHPGVVEVWNIPSRKGIPEFTVFSPSPVLTVQFSPHTSRFLIGGCYNGQLVVWDLKNLKTSKNNPSHKNNPSNKTHPICSVKVTGTQNMMTLTSIDVASRLCMWTLENLQKPIHSSVLSKNESFADLQVTVLTEVPNETNAFIVGCADGTVGKIGFGSEEKAVIEPIAAHSSRVTAIDVQKTAFNLYRGEKLVLSASLDNTVMLMDMKKKITLAVFEGHSEYVMDVKWHPKKPSVFASLDANGLVYLWDVTANLDYPMYELRLPNAAKKILWSHDGKRLIAGDSEGVVRVYSVHVFVVRK